MIDELMEMVTRAEDHAHTVQLAPMTVHDEQPFTARFMYVPDAQPMMIGVA
jgi:hypothetical protein